MASAWITTRTTKDGGKRYRVEFRLGGRESATRYGGSFRTKRQADERKRWIAGELAAKRVPEIRFSEPAHALTLAAAAAAWQESRVDVAANTRLQHRSAVRRALPKLGKRPVAAITALEIAELVGALHANGKSRESIRKTLTALALVFDHAEIAPNPARDRIHIKLPREQRAEISPPTAGHLLAVYAILPPRYRLPLLALDATGMRLGELEQLSWGDVDEQRGRWRVSQAVSKTGRARWVPVPPELFAAVCALLPREDRTPERRVFQGFGADRFRTAVTRACSAAAVPHFSPHDLRHRRISLLHLGGEPWARIGEQVGQRNLAVTANTYSHVLIDEAELNYEKLLV
jgi:integrase